MIASMAAGAVVGLGLLMLVAAFLRPVPGVSATISRLDGARGHRSFTESSAEPSRDKAFGRVRDSIGDRLASEALARGWTLTRTREDLSVMSRPLATHLGTKALLALGAFLWLPAVVWLVGYGSSIPVPAVAAIASGIFGFFLPDLALHREAERRRRDFRHVASAFLDLVAMNLAGGRGLPEALVAASSFGDHWAMVRLRQALSNARIMGWTPWEGIAQLGRDMGIDEMRDLAASLALAGDEGARIRLSLSARAESMRRKELVEVEGAAGESSQSMLMAQLLMCIAFLIFLAYPAISQLV